MREMMFTCTEGRRTASSGYESMNRANMRARERYGVDLVDDEASGNVIQEQEGGCMDDTGYYPDKKG